MQGRLISGSPVAVCLAAIGGALQAGAFELRGQDASRLGHAFAESAAATENVSMIFDNSLAGGHAGGGKGAVPGIFA